MVATVWYLILTSVLSVVQFHVERHYARGALRTLPPTPLQRLAPAGELRVRAWVRRDTPRTATMRDGRAHPSRSRCTTLHKWYGAHGVLDGIDLTVRPGRSP